MKNVASLFTDEALMELKKQLDIELVNDKDYIADELDELYCRITDEFPYEFDADGKPLRLGKIFEDIIDVFCTNGLITMAEAWCKDGKYFSDYFEKYIRISCVDDDIVVGYVVDYTSALDNEPDPESITVRRFELEGEWAIETYLCEVFANEIDRIEEIQIEDIRKALLRR